MKDLHIESFFYPSPLRNWSYLLWNSRTLEAWAIDPFLATEILDRVDKKGLRLKAILNTHEHWDHIQGNEMITKATGCEIWAGEGLKLPRQTRQIHSGEELDLDSHVKLNFHHTPGHTLHHFGFSLHCGETLSGFFSGDTLFNAGVGNCRNGGDPEVLYHTVQQLKKFLPVEATLYPGHDYREKNLSFFSAYAPPAWVEKLDLESSKQASLPSHITSLENERCSNLFWRCDDKELQQHLSSQFQTGLLDEKACFLLLRKLRDNF